MRLDEKKLTELYGSMDAAKPIIKIFIEKSPALIDELEQAIMLETPAQISAVCHRLLGQSLYIACPDIEQLTHDIKTADNLMQLEHLKQLKKVVSEIANAYA